MTSCTSCCGGCSSTEEDAKACLLLKLTPVQNARKGVVSDLSWKPWGGYSLVHSTASQHQTQRQCMKHTMASSQLWSQQENPGLDMKRHASSTGVCSAASVRRCFLTARKLPTCEAQTINICWLPGCGIAILYMHLKALTNRPQLLVPQWAICCWSYALKCISCLQILQPGVLAAACQTALH